jgi:hypothetical protein
MEPTLKLVTRYDAAKNEFVVLRHNLKPEEVDNAIRDLSARLFALFVIDQGERHPSGIPECCEACRKEVERTSHVQPQPTPKRRTK